MKPSKSKAIVVDASVLRSAGTKENPASIHSREILQTIMDYCHRAVVTGAMTQEWHTHASLFSVRWLAAMTAKKKLQLVTEPEAYAWLLAKLETGVDPEPARQAVTKDFHLLIAALETDKTIITRDERLRQILHVAAGQIGELRSIMCANPDFTEEEIVAWLNRGAPAEKKRCLGYHLRKYK